MSNNLIVLDSGLCNACNLCARSCPQMVFEQSEQEGVPRVTHPERCMGCMACEDDCPKKALRVHRLPDDMAPSELPVHGQGLDPERLYDVLIVGAGPAGLVAAIRARGLGLDVAVIERLPSSRRSHHPDGGILQTSGVYTLRATPEGLHIVELDLLLPPSAYRGPMDHMLLMGPGGVCSRTSPAKRPPIQVIRKDGLVESLANRARELGVPIAHNTRARRIRYTAGAGGGTGEILLDGDLVVRGRLIISAEGINGTLAAEASVPVNERAVGWAYALLIEQPPLPRNPSENGFLVGRLEHLDEDVPFLSFWGTMADALEVATGPVFARKHERLRHPLEFYLEHLFTKDERLSSRLGQVLAGRPLTHRDGCRVFGRRLPRSAVADGIIAIGDALAPSGMLLNLPAMKTGEMAAEVAAKALGRQDVRAASLREFDARALKHPAVTAMNWMNGLLIEAPMRLGPDEMKALFRMLERLSLDELLAGGLRAAYSMGGFFLRNLAPLLKRPELRCYLDGSGGPALG